AVRSAPGRLPPRAGSGGEAALPAGPDRIRRTAARRPRAGASLRSGGAAPGLRLLRAGAARQPDGSGEQLARASRALVDRAGEDRRSADAAPPGGGGTGESSRAPSPGRGASLPLGEPGARGSAGRGPDP